MLKYIELSAAPRPIESLTKTELKNIERGIKSSLERLNPLSGLSEEEQIDFVMNFLTDDDRLRLVKALKFYEEIITIKPQEK